MDAYGKPQKKTRSFSLGGEEKENPKPQKNKRHNSPIDTIRHRNLQMEIEGHLESVDLLKAWDDKKPKLDFGLASPKKQKSKEMFLDIDLGEKKKEFTKKGENKNIDNQDEEMKVPEISKVEPDKQSTDEEDKAKKKAKKENSVDKKMEDSKEEEKKEEEKEEELPPREKEIKEELKEETLDLLWRL